MIPWERVMLANRYPGIAQSLRGHGPLLQTSACSAYRDKAPASCRRHIRFSQRQVIQPAPSR